MKNLNENIKNNLKEAYKKYNAEFSQLSFSSESNRSCVNSNEKVINGDKFKEDCCGKKYKNINSVDAISFNENKMKFFLIEFKIKRMRHFKDENLIVDLSRKLNQKFEHSWDCIGHKIDTEYIFQKSKQERLLVYEFLDHRNIRLELNKMKQELEKYNINMRNAGSFLKDIDAYKFILS